MKLRPTTPSKRHSTQSNKRRRIKIKKRRTKTPRRAAHHHLLPHNREASQNIHWCGRLLKVRVLQIKPPYACSMEDFSLVDRTTSYGRRIKHATDHSHHFAFGIWLWRLSSRPGYRLLRRRRN